MGPLNEYQYGNSLYAMIMKMVEIGFLEHDPEEIKIRANPEFDIPMNIQIKK